MLRALLRLVSAIALITTAVSAQPSAITITARRVVDGKGGGLDNGMVTVANGRITKVGPVEGTPTLDLGDATLLPGFIDTHVHIDWHFDAQGRYHTGPEPP